jgi:hypothetical protein
MDLEKAASRKVNQPILRVETRNMKIRGCNLVYEGRSMQYDWEGKNGIASEPTIIEILLTGLRLLLRRRTIWSLPALR